MKQKQYCNKFNKDFKNGPNEKKQNRFKTACFLQGPHCLETGWAQVRKGSFKTSLSKAQVLMLNNVSFLM